MTKYLIRCVSRATANNRNFAGDVVESYHGKGGHGCGLYHYSKSGDIVWQTPFIPRHDAMEYGYDRISDAKRNYSYKNAGSDEFWTEEVEIIAIEV